MFGRMIRTKKMIKIIVAIIIRPRIWKSALVQIWRLAPNQWYRYYPYLPIPAKEWIDFRLQTAYGTTEIVPPPEDVINFLEWTREFK